MANKEQGELYDSQHQFNIFQILIYRDGWKEEDKKDLKNMMVELNIYEDLFSSTITGKLVLMDMTNLSDNFPLVGGERIDITYNTPFQTEMLTLSFVVGSVKNRVRPMNNAKYQGLVLDLVTPDRFKDVNLDLSMTFKGPYSEIVKAIIKTFSNKNVVIDNSVYNQTFISPYWSPLKCCKQIAKRAVGDKYEPFMFYETVDGYNFKSVDSIYNANPYCKLFIQPGKTGGLPPEKAIRKIIEYDDDESGNRIRQTFEYGFGSNAVVLDTVVKRHTEQNQTYADMSRADNYVKIDKFPVVDVMDGNRSKHEFIPVRVDRSHEGHFYRNSINALIDNFRYKVLVPGDSGYRVGQIVELDIPDASITKYRREQLTSGRWLIASLRHSIARDSYYTTLELMKDSHSTDIAQKVKGMYEYDKTRGATGTNSPDVPTQTIDSKPRT